MKPLTNEDLPVLAEIIRETIYRDAYIEKNCIFVKCNERTLAVVTIRNSKVFSNKKITGVPMKPHCHMSRPPDWQILI
jgi:hypothetical protein